MGKRSDFERVERDYYPTPYEAVGPMIGMMRQAGWVRADGKSLRFVEPCAGDGRLIEHLEAHGLVCTGACDIEPRRAGIDTGDALNLIARPGQADLFITNPPWDRDILHPLIERLSDQLPTWLLFDADWMHTQQAAAFRDRCAVVVSVGRVRWIEGSKDDGKDNAAWYLFQKPRRDRSTQFIWRS